MVRSRVCPSGRYKRVKEFRNRGTFSHLSFDSLQTRITISLSSQRTLLKMAAGNAIDPQDPSVNDREHLFLSFELSLLEHGADILAW